MEEVFKKILNCAFEVHTGLGPGLLESAYKECMLYELDCACLLVEKEKPLPVIYKEVALDIGFRVDFLVEEKIIVEVKAVQALNDVHLAQILTYMRLNNCKLGLLLNFNVRHMKDGIKRVML